MCEILRVESDRNGRAPRNKCHALGSSAGSVGSADGAQGRCKRRGPLAKALENPKHGNWHAEDLGRALAALAARMEPKDAAVVAARGAQVLAKALENSKETDAKRLSSFGWSLGGLARLIYPARQTQLAALSNMLLEEVSGLPKQGEEEPEKRKQLAEFTRCSTLRIWQRY